MTHPRPLILAAAASVLLIVGVGTAAAERAPEPQGCLEIADQAAPPLPGETFVTTCQMGEGQYLVIARGFNPGETLDIQIEDAPARARQVMGNGYTADAKGEARFILTGVQESDSITLIGEAGLQGGAPFGGKESPLHSGDLP